MRKKLVIYGASNPCVLKILNAINRVQPSWDLVGFVDDAPEKQGKAFYSEHKCATWRYRGRKSRQIDEWDSRMIHASPQCMFSQST
jgi:hypothetical protein